MMELDELKQKWAEHDRKLEVNIHLTRQLLSATKMNRARSALQRLAVFLALESAVALAIIIVLGSFIGDHIATVRFVAPAAALDLFEIATLIVLIQQIRLALYIDYSKPVAAIQKQLESLRMLHIRHFQWTLLLAPLSLDTTPDCRARGIFAGRRLQNTRSRLSARQSVIRTGHHPAGDMAVEEIRRPYGPLPEDSWLMKELAGYNLNAASDFLATLSEFEEEKRDN